MPTYCFITERGRRREETMTANEMLAMKQPDGRFLLDNGEYAHRDYRAEMAKATIWPELASLSLAVMADRKAEAEAAARKIGVPTEYRKEGDLACPVFASREHRNRFLKATKHIDLDGGYGDYTGD